MRPAYHPHRPENEGNEALDRLLSDLAEMTEHLNPLRDRVLRLALKVDAERHGPGTTLSLERLNTLLASFNQPLATMTEVNAWYGDPVPAGDLN